MSFRVEQLRSLLGPGLEQLVLNHRTGQRLITCVTLVSDLRDLEECKAGELVLVAPGPHLERCLFDAVQGRTRQKVAAVLAPCAAISGGERQRLRELAEQGDVAAGLLATGLDLRTTANSLSRELVALHVDTALARLHAADTLQGLAETLGRLIGNSITIESPRHELLANSPAGGDVDRNREETILLRHGSGKIMEHPIFEEFLARVRVSDWPLHLPAYPELGFAGRIVMRVAAEGELFALIWATDTARPLQQSDFEAIKQAADVAAAIFRQERAAAQRQSELRVEFLDDVINGRITNPENVRTVARTVGWNIDRLQQALVVAIDDFENFRLRHAGGSGSRLQQARERLAEIVNLEVLAVDPEAVVGLRSSDVVVLFDVRQDDPASRKAAALRLGSAIVNRVAAFLADLTVTVGVGRDFPSFEHMAESFRQAELAVQLGASLWGGNRAIHYDDLGVHRVLFALQEHEGMMTPALERIIAYDELHGTQYVHTLAVYLRNMGKLRPAAAELGVHRNTLEYRIGRIVELAGVELEDADNRLALELGIRMLELQPAGR